MNVLVLGSAGYIGSELTSSLVKLGYDVIGVDSLYYHQGTAQVNLIPYRFFDETTSGTYAFYRLDCNKFRDIKPFVYNADIIFPLFALVGAPLCESKQNLAKKTNLESIKKIVDNLGKDQRVIFTNSNSGYGSSAEICTEESKINCLSLYAQTKYDAEQYILNKHNNSVVFRLATAFGMSLRPRFDLLVNNLIYDAYFNKRLKIFNPNYRRNFCHVADIVQGLHWAIENGGNCEIYNLGNDKENKTKLELANQINKYFGNSVDIEICDDGNDPDKRDYIVSSEKLKNAGFTANVGIDHAIREFQEYFESLPKRKKIREKLLKYNRNY